MPLTDVPTSQNTFAGLPRHQARRQPNYDVAYAGDFYDDIGVAVQRLMSIGGIYASPVLADGVLYIASTYGSVNALI